jgi:histidine triad (HIT) family protein
LLIPVAEAQYLADLPGATQAELGLHVCRMTAAVKRATGCPAVNVVVNDGPLAGQEVPHVHIHVVPRWPHDGKGFLFKGAADPQQAAMAVRLRAAWGI